MENACVYLFIPKLLRAGRGGAIPRHRAGLCSASRPTIIPRR